MIGSIALTQEQRVADGRTDKIPICTAVLCWYAIKHYDVRRTQTDGQSDIYFVFSERHSEQHHDGVPEVSKVRLRVVPIVLEQEKETCNRVHGRTASSVNNYIPLSTYQTSAVYKDASMLQRWFYYFLLYYVIAYMMYVGLLSLSSV